MYKDVEKRERYHKGGVVNFHQKMSHVPIIVISPENFVACYVTGVIPNWGWFDKYRNGIIQYAIYEPKIKKGNKNDK
jgi:hypothetical protein